MNLLNERLMSIRVQKSELRKQIRDETNRKRLMELADAIAVLSDEEQKCLRELNL